MPKPVECHLDIEKDRGRLYGNRRPLQFPPISLDDQYKNVGDSKHRINMPIHLRRFYR